MKRLLMALMLTLLTLPATAWSNGNNHSGDFEFSDFNFPNPCLDGVETMIEGTVHYQWNAVTTKSGVYNGHIGANFGNVKGYSAADEGLEIPAIDYVATGAGSVKLHFSGVNEGGQGVFTAGAHANLIAKGHYPNLKLKANVHLTFPTGASEPSAAFGGLTVTCQGQEGEVISFDFF